MHVILALSRVSHRACRFTYVTLLHLTKNWKGGPSCDSKCKYTLWMGFLAKWTPYHPKTQLILSHSIVLPDSTPSLQVFSPKSLSPKIQRGLVSLSKTWRSPLSSPSSSSSFTHCWQRNHFSIPIFWFHTKGKRQIPSCLCLDWIRVKGLLHTHSCIFIAFSYGFLVRVWYLGVWGILLSKGCEESLETL